MLPVVGQATVAVEDQGADVVILGPNGQAIGEAEVLAVQNGLKADGIAPAAGYLAISGEWSRPWMLLPVLVLAVGTWIGGFDILYSLQDVRVDRKLGLHSIPARFGTRVALRISAVLHIVTILCLMAIPTMMPELGAGYAAALVVTAVLLGLEHGLVDPDSPDTIHRAFFTINVWLASIFALLVLLDRLL